MKPQRNAPCPCGSGKKYKQCCLRKDQETAASLPVVAKTPPPLAPLPPQRPVRSEEDIALEAAWNRFRKDLSEASYEQKIEMLREKLHGIPPAEIDAEAVFDLLGPLCVSLRCVGRSAEIEDDLRWLHESNPDIYESEQMWFEIWRVENAILSGLDPTPNFLRLCTGANLVIESFFHLLEMMRYHGLHSALFQGLPIALDLIENDDDISGRTYLEMLSQWANIVIHQHLEQNPELQDDDAGLKDSFSRITSIRWDSILEDLEERRQSHQQTWQVSTFNGSFNKIANPLRIFLWAFDAMLARHTGWPATRLDLAREAIFDMVQEISRKDSEDNQVHPSERLWMTRPQKKKKPTRVRKFPLIPPNMQMLDEHLARCFRPLFGYPYRGEVLLQAIPWWLAFLAEHGLTDKATAEQTWQAIREKFASSILSIVTHREHDQILAQHMRQTFDLQTLPQIQI